MRLGMPAVRLRLMTTIGVLRLIAAMATLTATTLVATLTTALLSETAGELLCLEALTAFFPALPAGLFATLILTTAGVTTRWRILRRLVIAPLV